MKKIVFVSLLALVGCARSPHSGQVAASPSGGDSWIDFNHNGVKDVYEDADASIDARVGNLLSYMTVDEKIGQLNQHYVNSEWSTGAKDFKELKEKVAAGKFGSLIWVDENPELRNEYQRIAVERSRLGIPMLFCLDVIHGFRTIFPIAPGLACSFEPELFERAQTVAAREASSAGIDLSFAPMCDVAADARWGRVAETCGEDPYLSAQCVAAQVRGFQGEDPAAPERIAACLKHFVGYGASAGGRDYTESELSVWTLRNRHLPQFRAGVKAGAVNVMSSFNSIDGWPAAACKWSLSDVLRGEWKFDGFVVSDWAGVSDLLRWGCAKDAAEAAAMCLNAGNDVDMVSGCFAESEGLAKSLADGTVSIDTVDEAVRRILRVKFKMGLFERPYVDESRFAKEKAKIEGGANRKLALECVEKSAVLLKNEGALPLKKDLKSVALIGPLSIDRAEPIGCWTWQKDLCVRQSLAEALKAALPKTTRLIVEKGCEVAEKKSMVKTDGKVVELSGDGGTDANAMLSRAVAAAKEADVVVMALGEFRGWTGENASRNTLGLTGDQQNLFNKVASLGKPIVAVIYSGRTLVLPEIWNKAAAVMYAWHPGTEAGEGIANLLVGKVSPSGRLSMSVPKDASVIPVNYNRLLGGRPESGGYRETGDYRPGAHGYEKFTFGYGLTYTKFEYRNERVFKDDEGRMFAEAEIANVGAAEAVETVQLYVRQHACVRGARPRRELRGFKRVSLKPGEKVKVVFALDEAALGYVDRDGSDRCDRGNYSAWIAPDANGGKELKFEF